MKLARHLLIFTAAVLAGCGKVADLRPPAGQPLPVKPAMASATPTPADLLQAPPYARPQRIDELMTRSTPREPDPFDLPPPSGGAAPELPAGADPYPVTNETGLATPK
ncbi:multidrug efflux pump subunit AcrA (membrane-fusion protein) [Sphingomonas sp. F9_3S_D5_B_2]